MQVNHLSHWLIAHEIVGHVLRQQVLKDASKVRDSGLRVVVLSSSIHTAGQIELDDLQVEHGYSGFKAYTNSKLANILTVRHMQSLLDR